MGFFEDFELCKKGQAYAKRCASFLGSLLHRTLLPAFDLYLYAVIQEATEKCFISHVEDFSVNSQKTVHKQRSRYHNKKVTCLKVNLAKLRIFQRRPGLSCTAQSPRKSPFKSGYFAVKPLSGSIFTSKSVGQNTKKTLN